MSLLNFRAKGTDSIEYVCSKKCVFLATGMGKKALDKNITQEGFFRPESPWLPGMRRIHKTTEEGPVELTAVLSSPAPVQSSPSSAETPVLSPSPPVDSSSSPVAAAPPPPPGPPCSAVQREGEESPCFVEQ